jgi:hypothetical protein
MTIVLWIGALVLAVFAFAVTLYFQRGGKLSGDGGGVGDFSSGHGHHYAGGDFGGDSGGGGDGGGGGD